jgi:hypothetical protein
VTQGKWSGVLRVGQFALRLLAGVLGVLLAYWLLLAVTLILTHSMSAPLTIWALLAVVFLGVVFMFRFAAGNSMKFTLFRSRRRSP